MPTTRLYMSMSLDGFITGPDDGPGLGLGRGGEALHEWLADGSRGEGVDAYRPDGPSSAVFDELMATGAVVTGRRTYDLAGGWAGDHHDGVPIVVLTRNPPAEAPAGTTFVADVAEAMRLAREGAGDRDVMMHGAAAAQAALAAGVLDELEIHLMPVLLGAGRRLFGAERADLEIVRVIDAPGVTHVRYRVRR